MKTAHRILGPDEARCQRRERADIDACGKEARIEMQTTIGPLCVCSGCYEELRGPDDPSQFELQYHDCWGEWPNMQHALVCKEICQ